MDVEGTPPKIQPVVARFKPRRGFSVEKVVESEEVGSLIAAAFNEFGDIIASKENGPLLMMEDTDDDGKFETVRPYCELVENCQGILALSGMVFVLGEGPDGHGLYKLTDDNRDGKLESALMLIEFEVNSSEHGAHGIVLGPDGKLYITAGNHTKLVGKFASKSPRRHMYEGDLIPRYEDPAGHAAGIRLPAGFILRTDIQGRSRELYASGLRNAYDLAFNSRGDLFTWDSDMESDSGTNWYRPTRLYNVQPGSEFGWRSGWSKWPEYYHDAVPGIADTGRGSPTGMIFYQHHAYPKEYRDAVFLADWSEGRILTGQLERKGSSYKVETSTFLEGKPLNVTDIDVGPDGMVYFVTGGRGTQGGVYRIKWLGKQDRPKLEGVFAAINAPQINSSWGRQNIASVQEQLGPRWNEEIVAAVRNSTLLPSQRLQALQIMQWVGPIPDANLLLQLSRDSAPELRKAAAYLMSSIKAEAGAVRLLELLGDGDATVRRQATESLVRSHRSVPWDYVVPLLTRQDAAERWAARRLLALDHPDEWFNRVLASQDVRIFLEGATSLMTAWPTRERALSVAERASEFLDEYISDDDFVDFIRMLQITVLRGDLKTGDIPDLAAALADEFPANDHARINRELLRLLVKLEVGSIRRRYLNYLDSDLSPADRIHAATHLRFLNTEWTRQEKLRIFRHLTPKPDTANNVAAYLRNVGNDFGVEFGPEEDLAIIRDGQNSPAAAMDAVLRLPEKLNAEQVRELIELDGRLEGEGRDVKRLKVAILAMLARDGRDQAMAYLRNVYDREPRRRAEVAIGLAEKPDSDNWSYIIRSLTLVDREIAVEMMKVLKTVPRKPTQAEPYRQVIMTGERLGKDGGIEAVRLLEYWCGFNSPKETPPWNLALEAWHNWYDKNYPGAPTSRVTEARAALNVDYDKLLQRVVTAARENEGSVENGRLVFSTAKCADCHRHGNLGESMGPDLTAIGKRFLPREILDSMLFPSSVISDQYKSKTLITDEGLSYTGIVGAGGQNELIVLQDDGKKVRIPISSIEQTVSCKVSAMPEGLLDKLSMEEVVDLMAFLRSAPEVRTAENVYDSIKR